MAKQTQSLTGPTPAPNKPSSSSMSCHSVPKPVAVLPQQQLQQILLQTRRTSSMTEDNQNKVIKASHLNSSSSITSSVPTAGSTNQLISSNTGTAFVPNLGKNQSMPTTVSASKTVTFSLTQVKTEPKPNTSQSLPKNSNSESSAPMAPTTQPIRLQIDSLGKLLFDVFYSKCLK